MSNLPNIFQSSVFLATPAFVVLTFTILLIPSLMVPGAKAEGAAKAIGCYIVKTFGLILMTLALVQLVYGLINGNLPQFQTLAALLLMLATGLGLLVHESMTLATVDDASASVVRAVFNHTCVVLGQMLAVIAALSMAMTFFLTQQITGWEMPATLLLLGLLLTLSASVHINTGSRGGRKSKRK